MGRILKFTQKVARLGAIALAIGVSASSASAFTVTGTTSDFGFGWTAPATGSPYILTGTGSVDITAFSATSITMTVVLTNTTDSGIYNSSDVRLTAWGFGIDPTATSVTFSDPGDSTGMVGAEISAIPSQKEIDVCAYGGTNCPGGSNGGIFGDGGTDTFELTVFGDFSGGTVQIAPLGYKFQTNFGSYEFSSTGSPSSTGTPSSTGVPEPGSTSLALLGLALLGAGFRARGKKKAQ
jgi:hypothetical protein